MRQRYNSVTQRISSCYIYRTMQKADKQTEIDSQVISNEPFSVIGNTRINGKCGQTWTLTSSMPSAIACIYLHGDWL